MGVSIPWGQSISQLQDLVLTAMCEGQLKEAAVKMCNFLCTALRAAGPSSGTSPAIGILSFNCQVINSH